MRPAVCDRKAALAGFEPRPAGIAAQPSISSRPGSFGWPTQDRSRRRNGSRPARNQGHFGVFAACTAAGGPC